MPVALFRYADGRPRTDLDRLFAGFRDPLFDVLARCSARGASYYCTRGFDSFSAQASLYSAWKARKPGAGRAAPAGYSAHQYGLAADFARDANEGRAGLQLAPESWTDEAFSVLGEEVAKDPRLIWGSTFNDRPHVQLAGFVTAKELEPLRALWLATPGDDLAKLTAVWTHITRALVPGRLQ